MKVTIEVSSRLGKCFQLWNSSVVCVQRHRGGVHGVGISPGVAVCRGDSLGMDAGTRLGSWAAPGQLLLLSLGQWEATEGIQNLGRGWLRRFLKDPQSGFRRLCNEYKERACILAEGLLL